MTAAAEVVGRSLAEIPGGAIDLLDEGTRERWTVEVDPFLLDRFPVVDAERRPLTDVSWDDAVRHCNAMSVAAGLTPCYSGAELGGDEVRWHVDADGFRLPTEAEWELACRAGSRDARYGDLDDIAWHAANSGGALHEVGGKHPNAWGLCDLIGNAWEWCWDHYDATTYGSYRVFRGGGFSDAAHGCRASCRRRSHPSFHIDDLGFRVARSLT